MERSKDCLISRKEEFHLLKRRHQARGIGFQCYRLGDTKKGQLHKRHRVATFVHIHRDIIGAKEEIYNSSEYMTRGLGAFQGVKSKIEDWQCP